MPDAWLLNYSNPQAMICWAMNDYTKIKNVGLCPNQRNLAEDLARNAGVPFNEVSYWLAGINHFAVLPGADGGADKICIRNSGRNTKRLFTPGSMPVGVMKIPPANGSVSTW